MTRHAGISYVKSAVRIAGYMFMLCTHIPADVFAAVFLIGAEVLGIVEEFGE
jgi:hypothetical protein